jgi:hypothetical protein
LEKKPDEWIEPSLASIGSPGTRCSSATISTLPAVDNFPMFLDKVTAIPNVRFVTYA